MMIVVESEGVDRVAISQRPGDPGHFSSGFHASFGTALATRSARDLLRVGQAAFLADRSFRRGVRLGQRTRSLAVTVPVEEPDRWSELADLVARVTGFVSQDHWRFEFTALPTEATGGEQGVVPVEDASVHLFSDGLDSLCGAAAALRGPSTPVFVSHSPPGRARVRQRILDLQESLGISDRTAHFAVFSFTASARDEHGMRTLFPERSRRTRPFLYLSMAGAVALELRASRVLLNENGVLAVNLPFRTGITGPQISRHAHPEALRRFEALLRGLAPDRRITVDNPFSEVTKGEAAGGLGGAAALAPDTVSCEYGRQQVARINGWLRDRGRTDPGIRQCGLCFPCLVRRTAMHHARIEEPDTLYAFDARRTWMGMEPNPDAPLYAQLSENVRELEAFGTRLLAMRPSEFVSTYLPELSLLPAAGEESGASVRSVHDLYRRFAREVTAYLRGGDA